MENQNETIVQYLENNKNNNIEVKPKSVIPAVVLSVLSLVLMIIASTPIIPGKYLSLTIIFITLITLIWGISIFIRTKKTDRFIFIYAPTNEIIQKESIYVSMSDVSKIRNCLSTNNYSVLQDVRREFQSGCCLDIWGAPKSDFYLLQIKEYVAYHYQPTSEVVIVKDKNAGFVKKLLSAKAY